MRRRHVSLRRWLVLIEPNWLDQICNTNSALIARDAAMQQPKRGKNQRLQWERP
jgi:hypothetical protein